jgi:hypothetical protein
MKILTVGSGIIHHSYSRSVQWPFLKWNCIGDNDERARQDACTSPACNSPANDEGCRVRSNSTYETSQFEEANCVKECPFNVEESENPSICRL